MKSIAVCAAIVCTFLAGCSSPPTVYTFTAREYRFDGPSELEGGVVTLRLDNAGEAPHHMAIVRLDEGHTMAEFSQAIIAGNESLPWMHWVAGPGPFGPGSGGIVTTDLPAGHYVMSCFVPDSDGIPHFAKGMMREFNVTASSAKATPPEPDLALDLADFHFTFDKAPMAGNHTVRIHNAGTQPHEAVLARLDAGATAEEFLAAFSPNATGPPPGSFVGGITVMGPGLDATVEWALPKGDYVLFCFVLDPTSHAPHFALGMQHGFTVA